MTAKLTLMLLGAVLTVALVIWLVWWLASIPGPPPIRSTDQLPAGAELIYADMGGDTPVRVIQVGDCYIVQVLDYRDWNVLDRGGFFATEASIDCGADATWSVP